MIPVPAPSGLFTLPTAIDATARVPPLIVTGPVKLFVLAIVKSPVPFLFSPVLPAMALGPWSV